MRHERQETFVERTRNFEDLRTSKLKKYSVWRVLLTRSWIWVYEMRTDSNKLSKRAKTACPSSHSQISGFERRGHLSRSHPSSAGGKTLTCGWASYYPGEGEGEGDVASFHRPEINCDSVSHLVQFCFVFLLRQWKQPTYSRLSDVIFEFESRPQDIFARLVGLFSTIELSWQEINN